VRVMVPAFYSLGMARVPVTVSMVTIAVTVALYFALMGPLHHMGLALATSIGSILNFAILFAMLRRKIGSLGGKRLAISGARIALASIAAAAAATVTAGAIEGGIGMRGVAARLFLVGASLAVAAVVYLALGSFLRVEELRPLLGWLSRWRKRR